jgi:hypothetical protein
MVEKNLSVSIESLSALAIGHRAKIIRRSFLKQGQPGDRSRMSGAVGQSLRVPRRSFHDVRAMANHGGNLP